MSTLEEFERLYVRPRQGRTLIVGSQVYGGKEDRRKRYADSVGVDMLPGPGVDVVLDLEEPPPLEHVSAYDHIECMSVLEHSRRPWLLAQTLELMMRPEATIFVSVPWIWRYHAYDHDYFRISADGLQAIFPNIKWSSLMYASNLLKKGGATKSTKLNGHPYMARTETCGFGRTPCAS